LARSIADAKLVHRTKSLMYLGYVTDGVLISLNRGERIYILWLTHTRLSIETSRTHVLIGQIF